MAVDKIEAAKISVTNRGHFYLLEDPPSAPRQTLTRLLDQVPPPRKGTEVTRGHVREARDHAAYGIYSYKSEPSFLKGTKVRELRYALLLLALVDRYLVVLTAGGVSWSDRFVEGLARRVEAATVGKLLDRTDVRFEKLASRNMSISRDIVREKVLEGVDLQVAVPPLGLSRQIVRTVRARSGRDVFTASPTTALILQQGERLDLKGYLRWARKVTRELASRRRVTPAFLTYFAEPIAMRDLPAGVRPNGVLLDLQWLRDGLSQDFDLCLRGRRDGDHWQAIPAASVRAAVDALSDVGQVATSGSPPKLEVNYPALPKQFRVGLRANKSSFALSERRLSRIHVVSRDRTESTTLTERIREEQCLFVTMTDVRYAFAHGHLFKDSRIHSHAGSIAECIHEEAGLASCKAEKASVRKRRTSSFCRTSVFGVIEHEIAKDDDVLICDDLGDEWADFIGLRSSNEPCISLYHGKHGDKTTSASAFQEVLGQAVKNAGRVAVIAEELVRKKDKWKKKWNLPKVVAEVPRLRRGGSPDDALALYAELAASAVAKKRICVVVSFASKAELEDVLERASTGKVMSAHEIQLLWLLVSFLSSCREVGAEPRIICSP